MQKVRVGDIILKVFRNFLSNRSQKVNIDGVCSSSIDIVSSLPEGRIFSSLLFLLYISGFPGLFENVLVGYADDSNLFCRIPHPRDMSSMAAALNDDLAMISDWCLLVNPS